MAELGGVVFVIDDDASIRAALEDLISSVRLDVRLFASPQEFLHSNPPDVLGCLVLDVRLPGKSGLTFQKELAKAGIGLPVVFITGHGDIPMSVRAMKAGAVEYLTKTKAASLPGLVRMADQLAAPNTTSQAIATNVVVTTARCSQNCLIGPRTR